MSPRAAESKMTDAPLPRWKLVVFSLLPSLALITALETAARYLEQDGWEYGPVPQSHRRRYVKIIGHGLISRGRITTNDYYHPALDFFAIRPDENCLRILFLGDSWTYGDAVSDGQRATDALQRWANREWPNQCIRIINGGECGAWIDREIQNWDRIKAPTRPHVVVLNTYVNDFPDQTRTLAEPLGAMSIQAGMFGLRSGDVYSTLFDALTFRLLPSLRASHPDWWTEGFDDAARSHYADRLRKLKADVTSHGAEFGLFLMPEGPEQHTNASPHEAFLRPLAASHGVPFRSAIAAFMAPDIPFPVVLFDGHPNVVGHRIIATYQYDWLFPKDCASPFTAIAARLPPRHGATPEAAPVE